MNKEFEKNYNLEESELDVVSGGTQEEPTSDFGYIDAEFSILYDSPTAMKPTVKPMKPTAKPAPRPFPLINKK